MSVSLPNIIEREKMVYTSSISRGESRESRVMFAEDSSGTLGDFSQNNIDSPERHGRLRDFATSMIRFDPIALFRKNNLMRAFVTWSKCIPLMQLCGELRNQLIERTSVFESMRESYLKDVISVKHHLENIAPLGKY